MSYSAAVITVSDKASRGERIDTSGPALCALLAQDGWHVVYTATVADEMDEIERELLHCADNLQIPLILTTGGTGFSPRDITPEATRALITRETPGICEAMRAESMKITPHGCLSRAISGIRGRSLIVNLPGSEKAARENLLAVIKPLHHGVQMLLSAGSAECASSPIKQQAPSIDAWLKEAKRDESAKECGMYLCHNGVVRESARAQAREGVSCKPVKAMQFSYDGKALQAAIDAAKKMQGIHYVRAWLNEGTLSVGDDIMRVLVGGDTRPNVINALQSLVQELKTNCVSETELFEVE